jgi:hypothetical protein
MTRQVSRRKFKQRIFLSTARSWFILQTVVIYGFVLLCPCRLFMAEVFTRAALHPYLLVHHQRTSLALNSVFLNNCWSRISLSSLRRLLVSSLPLWNSPNSRSYGEPLVISAEALSVLNLKRVLHKITRRNISYSSTKYVDIVLWTVKYKQRNFRLTFWQKCSSPCLCHEGM